MLIWIVFVSKRYFTTLLNLIFFCHRLGVALICGCSQGTHFSTLDSAPACLRRLLDQSVLFFQRTCTCIRTISRPAVVRIRRSGLLHLSHGSPFLFPHLHFRLSGPRGHVWHVSFLALSAVPVRSAMPVLDGLFAETPVPRSPSATSRGALVTPLAQSTLHVVVLSLGAFLHGMHFHAVTVVTTRALRDRLDTPWCSAIKHKGNR